MNAAFCASLLALAGPTGIAADADPQGIIAGTEVDPCAWPSTGRVSGDGYSFGAVLIHPQVVALNNAVMTTAPNVASLVFTFGVAAGAFGPSDGLFVSTPITNCNFEGNFGVCTLDEPVPIAYAPPLVGCEQGALEVDSELTIVGFGNIGSVENRDKHAGSVTVTEIFDTGIIYVEGEAGPCAGDSGSPAFVRLEDGSWRTVAVAAGNQCGGLADYISLRERIRWIEEVTGFDVTPCHDADGLPEPGADCHGFFAGGADDFGTWDVLCSDGPVGGSGGVCSSDQTPPTVAIDTPSPDATYPDVPSTIVVEATADDARGLGVRDVRLSINDEVLPNERTEPPYTFEVNLPEGIWTLTALARDWGGNAGESNSVTVIVGDPPLPMPGSTSGGPDDTGEPADDTGASAETTGDTDTTDPAGPSTTDPAGPDTTADDTGETDDPGSQSDGGGCGCSANADHDRGWLLGLACFSLVAFRRRRSIATR